KDDAFGRPGRARGEKQEGRVLPAAARGLVLQETALCSGELPALLQEGVVTDKLRPVVVAHAPVLVVDDAANRWAPGQDFEQLIDLFLVLGEDVAYFRALNRRRHLIGRRVLIERARQRHPASAPHTSLCRGAADCRPQTQRAPRVAHRALTMRPPARLPRQPVRATSRCARCRAFSRVAPDARRAASNGEGAALERCPLLLFRSPSIGAPDALQHGDPPDPSL